MRRPRPTALEHAAYARWRRVLRDVPLPAMLVDLDALDANLAELLGAIDRAAPSRTAPSLRLATKSLRCPALTRYLLEHATPRAAGLMTYSADETRLLAEAGFDDLLLGYPVAQPGEAQTLARLSAAGGRVVAMVDCEAHVALLAKAVATEGGRLEVCIDVDASLRPARGVHLGVRRSPVRSVQDALAVARRIDDASGLALVGVMLYEAQVAGLPDRVPGKRLLGAAQRAIKAASRPRVAARRKAVVEALRAAGHAVRLVNGGGTGSVASTAADPSVTELTVGSGFYTPRLFDHYDGLALQPAAFFALPVARSSDAGLVTCGFGGLIASGPPGPDRTPVVHLPAGLEALAHEGFGEVQTPLRVPPGAPRLELGDPVLCRHAKAGEPLMRFGEVWLVRGEEVVERVPTYRALDPRVL